MASAILTSLDDYLHMDPHWIWRIWLPAWGEERLPIAFTSKQLKTSNATEDPDGYSFDWLGGLTYEHLVVFFDEVSLHYNGPSNKKCCHGYKKVSKYPKKGDVEPFLIPGLCWRSPKDTVHFTARVEKQVLTMKYTSTPLKSWPCDEGKKEDIKERRIRKNRRRKKRK